MNWLGRIVFGVKKTEALDDELIRCPACKVSSDFTRCFSIVGARVAGARIETVERGATYSCQRCSHVFTLTPAGPLERHRQALPVMASARPEAPPPAPDGEPQRKPGKVRVEELVPKERPR